MKTQANALSPVRLQSITDAIGRVAESLPRQGPITKFAFLNPLLVHEAEPFDDVMRRVGECYGNEAYLPDSRYRQEFHDGRIAEVDLHEVLLEDLGDRAGERVAGLTERLAFRLATLIYPFHFGHRRELAWVLAETEALERFRPEVDPDAKREMLDAYRQAVLQDNAGFVRATGITGRDLSGLIAADWESGYLRHLWQALDDGMRSIAQPSQAPLATAGIDQGDAPGHLRACDRRVDELMFRFTAAYLDQGYAFRRLPSCSPRYWESFCTIFGVPSRLAPRWRRTLSDEIKRISVEGWSPLEVIALSLDRMSIAATDTETFINASLRSLRGFAGMIWQTEIRPDLFQKPSPPGTLTDLIAARLLLLSLVGDSGRGASSGNQASVEETSHDALCRPLAAEQLAFLLFELAQMLRWHPHALERLTSVEWRELKDELVLFCDHERRRVFHVAWERGIAKMALRIVGSRARLPATRPAAPSFQVVCCIDAREESLRRHLEELDPDVETFGIAGFFGVPMYYRGAGAAGFSAQCPIVMKPRHWVVEEAVYSLEESDRNRSRARRWVGTAQRRFQAESRRTIGGAVVSTLLGPLATIPMLSRILFPRTTAIMGRAATQFIAPPSITRLRLERDADCQPAPPTVSCDGGVGFTLDEMAEIAGRALQDIGLTHTFAPLVVLMGHGSGCINNPHESAYHCGACAGNSGGPNARALAAMLNDRRVRMKLSHSGISIPEDTFFLGAHHHTATEEMMFYDLELLPTRKVKQVRQVRRLLGEAAMRNAHERCRRFESADLDASPAEALLHVQNRSEDLAQTRPEYGNGGNAICFVGRRATIRGLFFDRRSFLMSYDATQDTQEATVLARVLGAVVPVCQGINALYSFSAIDPTGWGAGTKLPHNITSLIGVMDGAASDLRPGLPWQGVDIHEPVRLLFIIEATPRSILKVMAENPIIDRIFRNHWAHVATLDPHTAQMHRFSKDRFIIHDPIAHAVTDEPPIAESSWHWYRGHRNHLPFAMIRPTNVRATPMDRVPSEHPEASSSC